MKNTKILFATIAFLMISSFVSAQQFHNLKKAVQPLSQMNEAFPKNSGVAVFTKHFPNLEDLVSRPGTSEDYIWDEENNEWVHYSNTLFTYSETGVLLIELATEAETGEYMSRYTHDYDENGNLTEEISYFWNGLDWIISSGYKYQFVYDDNGKLIDEIGSVWSGSDWENEYKNTYVYDGNDEPGLMLGYNWNGTNWTLYNQYIDIVWYSFEYGQPESYTLQFKIEGGMWVNEEHFSAIYDGGNSISVIEKWMSNNWVNSERNTYSKDAMAEIIKTEHWNNLEWVNFEQYSNSFDEYGNTDGYLYEFWSGSQWELVFEYLFGHTYNENADVIETVVQFWDSGFTEPMNVSRYLYSDFLYFVTDVPDVRELDNVVIYPNPVKNSVSIQIDKSETQSFFVNVIDLNGKTLFSEIYSGSAAIVNLDKFETGIYILRMRTNTGRVYSHKLIKE